MRKQTTMYADMSRDEREKLMAAQCLRTETVDYSRTLSDDETVAEQNSYTREAMGLEALEAEFKQVQASFRSKIKAIKDVMTQSLKVISTGKRQLNGKLFLFPDHQSNEMRYFDVYGELVNKRPLIPQERQTKLFIGGEATGAKHGEDNGHLTEDTNFEIVSQAPEHTEEAKNEVTATETKPDKKRPAKRAGKAKPEPKPEPGTDINEKVKGMTESHKARKENATNKPESRVQGHGDLNPNNNIPAGAPGPDEEGFNDEAGALEVERKINSDEDDDDNLPD